MNNIFARNINLIKKVFWDLKLIGWFFAAGTSCTLFMNIKLTNSQGLEKKKCWRIIFSGSAHIPHLQFEEQVTEGAPTLGRVHTLSPRHLLTSKIMRFQHHPTHNQCCSSLMPPLFCHYCHTKFSWGIPGNTHLAVRFFFAPQTKRHAVSPYFMLLSFFFDSLIDLQYIEVKVRPCWLTQITWQCDS